MSTDDQVVRTEVIGVEPAEALAGLLDIPLPDERSLPPLWHWVYLRDLPPQRDLGPDGHPLHGVPAPPGPGRRRMFAGGRVTAHGRLRFGEPATLTTRVSATRTTTGRSGGLTFVTTRTDIGHDDGPVIVEEQDIVYREPGGTSPPAADPSAGDAEDAPTVDTDQLTFDVTPTALFRFSALTYNAHRIHYDLPYAQDEGYTGLVVHGPLQALLMSEFLRRSGVDLTRRTFSYRLVAPMIGPQRLTVRAPGGDDAEGAEVLDGAGRVTARSRLETSG
jgi:3-methylfumaryl-CoA hydratase